MDVQAIVNPNAPTTAQSAHTPILLSDADDWVRDAGDWVRCGLRRRPPDDVPAGMGAGGGIGLVSLDVVALAATAGEPCRLPSAGFIDLLIY